MKTEYQILQEVTRLENLDISPDVDYLTRINALLWVLDGKEIGNVPKADSAQPQLAEGRPELKGQSVEEVLKSFAELVDSCKMDDTCIVLRPNMGRYDCLKISWKDLQLALQLRKAREEFDRPSFG